MRNIIPWNSEASIYEETRLLKLSRRFTANMVGNGHFRSVKRHSIHSFISILNRHSLVHIEIVLHYLTIILNLQNQMNFVYFRSKHYKEAKEPWENMERNTTIDAWLRIINKWMERKFSNLYKAVSYRWWNEKKIRQLK